MWTIAAYRAHSPSQVSWLAAPSADSSTFIKWPSALLWCQLSMMTAPKHCRAINTCEFCDWLNFKRLSARTVCCVLRSQSSPDLSCDHAVDVVLVIHFGWEIIPPVHEYSWCWGTVNSTYNGANWLLMHALFVSRLRASVTFSSYN